MARQFDGVRILPQRGGEPTKVAIKVKLDAHLDVVVGVDGLSTAISAQDVVRSPRTRWMRSGRREPQSVPIVIGPCLRRGWPGALSAIDSQPAVEEVGILLGARRDKAVDGAGPPVVGIQVRHRVRRRPEATGGLPNGRKSE